MKCIGKRWFIEVIEHLQDNPYIVVDGFKHAGIHQDFGILTDESDLSIYSDDSTSDDFELFDKDGLPDNLSTQIT